MSSTEQIVPCSSASPCRNYTIDQISHNGRRWWEEGEEGFHDPSHGPVIHQSIIPAWPLSVLASSDESPVQPGWICKHKSSHHILYLGCTSLVSWRCLSQFTARAKQSEKPKDLSIRTDWDKKTTGRRANKFWVTFFISPLAGHSPQQDPVTEHQAKPGINSGKSVVVVWQNLP